MNTEIKNLLSLGLYISAALIIISSIFHLIVGLFVGSFGAGFLTFYSSPLLLSFVFLFIFLTIIGLAIGFSILNMGRKLRIDTESFNWTRLIIISVVAIIIANGFLIGALLALVIGIVGYADSRNLLNLPSLEGGLVGKRVCQKCGFVNSGTAKFCSSCGNQFNID